MSKSKELTLNINAECRVVLTDHGAAVYNAVHAELASRFDLQVPIMRAGDTYDTQLWILMQTFGPYIIMGGPIAFEDNAITLLRAEEETMKTFVCTYVTGERTRPMVTTEVRKAAHFSDAALGHFADEVVESYHGNRTDMHVVAIWMERELATRISIYCIEDNRLFHLKAFSTPPITQATPWTMRQFGSLLSEEEKG